MGKFIDWFRGSGFDLSLQGNVPDGLSPLAWRIDRNATLANLQAWGADLRTIENWDDLPITAGAVRFIQSKISAMPRRLINKQTGEVREKNPRWMEQANRVNSFTTELNTLVAELIWNGEAFIWPIQKRGMLDELYVFSTYYVEQLNESHRWVVPGRVGWPVAGRLQPGALGRPRQPGEGIRWAVNGEWVPGMIQVKVGERVNDLRGHGIKEIGQTLLQAYDYALRWTNKLYKGNLTQLLTGDFAHMNEKEQDSFKDSFQERSVGIENLGELIFVPAKDVKLQNISLDPVQMAHIDMLKELARSIVTQLFMIPAQMFNLNDSGTQITYTTVPALAERLDQDCLQYYVVAVQDAFTRMMRMYEFDLDNRRQLGGSVSDMSTRAKTMTEINRAGDAPVFTDLEIRETAGFHGWPEELTEIREKKEAEAEEEKMRAREVEDRQFKAMETPAPPAGGPASNGKAPAREKKMVG